VGRKTFFLAKQQKHLQSTPLAEPIRTGYVLATCAHFFAVFCWSKKKRVLTRCAVLTPGHPGTALRPGRASAPRLPCGWGAQPSGLGGARGLLRRWAALSLFRTMWKCAGGDLPYAALSLHARARTPPTRRGTPNGASPCDSDTQMHDSESHPTNVGKIAIGTPPTAEKTAWTNSTPNAETTARTNSTPNAETTARTNSTHDAAKRTGRSAPVHCRSPRIGPINIFRVAARGSRFNGQKKGLRAPL